MTKGQTSRLHILLGIIGGLTYNAVELLWRGRTHWSMFLVGGACFELIGYIARRVRAPLVVKCGLCTLVITAVELISGCIVNLWLQLAVWDYSRMRFNIKGQVCLLYSSFWMLLSLAAMPLYEVMYQRLFCRRLTKGG